MNSKPSTWGGYRGRTILVVGFVDDGAPYLVSQLFVYDDEREAVFFHGAADGRTRGIVEGGAGSGNGTDDGNEDETGVDACLAVHEMGRFVPAEHPVNFDVEYASVVVFGRVRLVESEAEKRRTLSLFMDAFAPHLEAGADYGEIRSESVGRTSVYRLDVEGWSGKRHEAESEADGFEPYGLADARESAGGRGSAAGRESSDARASDRDGST